MTNFANHHQGRWRDGDLPKHGNATVIVNYDQRNDAYDIQPHERDAFIKWVAAMWETDNEPRDIEGDEAAADYLDRIGVSVSDIA